jgi:DNA-directed RNA polymerase specialized sigma24 family protein
MIFPSFLTILNKQTGSSDDFEKNTFPFLDILYNFALRMTGNENDAENLIQETFLRAFRFYNHLDEETDHKSWLFRIIKNVYEDFNKKFPGNKEIVDISEIAKALASLPVKLKTVLILSEIEEFSHEEIVAFTDCPLLIVKERLNEAGKVLYKRLNIQENLSDPEIQSFIKNLIKEKLKREPTPGHIRKRIIKKIK